MHQFITLIQPDVAETSLTHIPKRVILPELIRVNIAKKIDIPNPDPG